LVKTELRHRKAISAEEKKQAAAEANANEKKGKSAEQYIEENNKQLKERLKIIELEAKVRGEAVSAQDKYNAYMSSYIDLLTKTEGLITEGMPIERERIAQLKEARKAVEQATDADEKRAAAIKYAQEATSALDNVKIDLTPAEDLHKAIEEIDKIKNKIQEVSEEEITAAQKGQQTQLDKNQLIKGLEETRKQLVISRIESETKKEESKYEQLKTKEQELLALKEELHNLELAGEEQFAQQINDIDERMAENKRAQMEELLTQVKQYTDQAAQIVKDAGDLALQYYQAQMKTELAQEEIRYRKGEIGEKEYEENKKKIKRKAAEEEYKIKMWQWSASILQATASTALGIAKSLELGFPMGLIAGTLVAAAGGVQMASLIANKPQPPHFAQGGFIGGIHGATMGADDTMIYARSGELIANAVQQRNLWEAMNGKGVHGKGTNIVINNNAANIVDAKPTISRNQIELLIDARVNESLKNGRYSNSLKEAENGMSGDFYGI